MSALVDITGQRFGRWTVLRRCPRRDNQRHTFWVCRCDCGTEREVVGCNLRLRGSSSCGCDKGLRTTHGGSYSSEYSTWRAMRARCRDPNEVGFKNYGGRGITVCDRWDESFAAFLEDMGAKPNKRLTLERVDNSRGYEPSNCIWATRVQQRKNRRTKAQVMEDNRRYFLSHPEKDL
jgi:hypothetical protein